MEVLILNYILVTKDCVAVYRWTLFVAFSILPEIYCVLSMKYTMRQGVSNERGKNTFELE